jgi:hypothetical protein
MERRLDAAARRNCAGRRDLTDHCSCDDFSDSTESHRVKNWEIIADNLKKAGWSWGCVSAVDSRGRTIWIADAHRDDGKRFVVRGMKGSPRLSNSKRRFAGRFRLGF